MASIKLADLLRQMNDPVALIKSDEEAYCKSIRDTALSVVTSGRIRVILLAGPSGSGKTTTANLLSDEIKRLGERSMVVSLDDFYLDANDSRYPRFADGGRNFESPYALNTDVLHQTLADIVAGRDFTVPKYDFKVGGCVGMTKYKGFANGSVIIEGIHGLNPMFSDPFPKDKLMRLFVSVSTNIEDEGGVILSGRKLRFIRRMVRDSIYRAADARRTLGMWEKVLEGENEYLYPYKHLADVRFDTFHRFEAAVMKPYAIELLDAGVRSESAYADIVARALERIPVIDSALVPDNSLIREFIHGGIYEHLY